MSRHLNPVLPWLCSTVLDSVQIYIYIINWRKKKLLTKTSSSNPPCNALLYRCKSKCLVSTKRGQSQYMRCHSSRRCRRARAWKRERARERARKGGMKCASKIIDKLKFLESPATLKQTRNYNRKPPMSVFGKACSSPGRRASHSRFSITKKKQYDCFFFSFPLFAHVYENWQVLWKTPHKRETLRIACTRAVR